MITPLIIDIISYARVRRNADRNIIVFMLTFYKRGRRILSDGESSADVKIRVLP